MLELTRKAGVQTHLVVTPAGQLTRACETDLSVRDLAAMADVCYRPADIAAAIASGSFQASGTIVAPCSIVWAFATRSHPRTWRVPLP